VSARAVARSSGADEQAVRQQVPGQGAHLVADGEPVDGVRPPARLALAVGNEGAGLKPSVRDACAGLVALPMAPGVDSLNVAVAAAIVSGFQSLSTSWSSHVASTLGDGHREGVEDQEGSTEESHGCHESDCRPDLGGGRLERGRELERELSTQQGRLASQQGSDLAHQAERIGEVNVLVAQVAVSETNALRDLMDQLKSRLGTSVVLLATADGEGKVRLIAGVSQDLTRTLKAGDLVNIAAAEVGGKGGGAINIHISAEDARL